MAADFRIFLSAVTSEFGTARDALAADLRSRDTLVRVQSDFRQEADSDTTLKKLHDYIRDCSAVDCGHMIKIQMISDIYTWIWQFPPYLPPNTSSGV
jgi:hypothetical protein